MLLDVDHALPIFKQLGQGITQNTQECLKNIATTVPIFRLCIKFHGNVQSQARATLYKCYAASLLCPFT